MITTAAKIVSFSKSRVIDTDTGDSEIDIFVDGDDLGVIRRESHNAATGASRDWYPRWIAAEYEVEFFIMDGPEDRTFTVEEFGTARRALAAARAYARSSF